MDITDGHKLGNGAALFTRDGGVAQKWANEVQADQLVSMYQYLFRHTLIVLVVGKTVVFQKLKHLVTHL